jgi:uridine phosphorylase
MIPTGFPHFPNKAQLPSFFSARDFIQFCQRGKKKGPTLPSGAILCYNPSFLKSVVQKNKASPGPLAGLFVLGRGKKKVLILGNFGIGAPAAVANLEELIAVGVKKIISIGSAGGLQKNLKIGDLVLCTGAIRDEGTSFHYAPPEAPALPSEELTKKLGTALDKIRLGVTLGRSWTTDAPYRESKEEVAFYQQEGILTVDMEASALFTVAQYHAVALACAFTISDSLAELRWNPQFDSKKTRLGMEHLLEGAWQTLTLDSD